MARGVLRHPLRHRGGPGAGPRRHPRHPGRHPHSLPGTGTSDASLPHRLAAALRDRRTLLVLDNCEHVIDAAAELTELLLRTAPGLRVLATGQQPLGLAGEAVFLVEPLPPTDAVRMFMERAASATPVSRATRKRRTRPSGRPSPRSAAVSTASRSRWNSPQPAYGPWE